VFLGNQFHGIRQCSRVIDVLGIGTNSTSQSALLGSGLLMGRIKKRLHLRVFPKHTRIEMPSERLSIFLQHRNGLFNNSQLALGKHGVTPVGDQ
jgi:hypothetical protein